MWSKITCLRKQHSNEETNLASNYRLLFPVVGALLSGITKKAPNRTLLSESRYYWEFKYVLRRQQRERYKTIVFNEENNGPASAL